MNCLQCGTVMIHGKTDIDYDSLPGVRLLGMEAYSCPSCGEEEVAIPQVFQLNELLARLLLKRHERLTGEQIRFLRKYLGFSKDDLAIRLEVATSTIQDWESSKSQIPRRMDLILRLLVASTAPIEDYHVQVVQFGENPPAPVQTSLQHEEAWGLV